MRQKVTFFNSQNLKLSGTFHLPQQKINSIVIISHGFAANKDRSRLIKVAKILAKNNIVAFRFDFGGCGESEDREITLKNQIDDLKSAINYVRENGYSKIGLLGESLGGLTSILAYDNNIKTLVLWAPVTKSKTPSILQTEKFRQELNDRGFVIYRKDGRNFKIPKEYFEERQNINQKEILSKIKSPVLIIHGDKDRVVPLNHSQRAMEYLSPNSRLEIIEGGNHTFDNHIEKIVKLSVKWFRKYL